MENIFIDGVYGIGNLEFSMKDIDVDYYISNLYKWMFVFIMVVFFYCKLKYFFCFYYLIILYLYGFGIVVECLWVGIWDYSVFVVVFEVIKFVKDLIGSIEDYS